MTQPELQQQVEAAQTRVDEIRATMEPLMVEFLEATTAFAQEWLWSETDDVVRKHPGTVREIGVKQLRGLKKDISGLSDEMADLVHQRVGDRTLWVHLAPNLASVLGVEISGTYPNPYRLEESGSPPVLLTGPVRLVLGDLGELLRKRGIDDPRWRKVDTRGFFKKKYHPEYKYMFEFTDDMLTTLEGYADAADELWQAVKELTEAQRDRDSAEAAEFWQEA